MNKFLGLLSFQTLLADGTLGTRLPARDVSDFRTIHLGDYCVSPKGEVLQRWRVKSGTVDAKLTWRGQVT